MELLGRGRESEVFALDSDRVLRRSRTRGSNDAEARLMTYLRERGYPVPRSTWTCTR